MKKNTKSSTKPSRIIYILLAGIATALLYGFIAHSSHLFPFNTDKKSSPVAVTLPVVKPNAQPTTPNDKSASNTPIDQNKTSDSVPVNTTLSVAISQLNEKNQTIYFGATVTNSSSPGTCVVAFTNPNDRPVTKQFVATNSSTTATCGPLTIPASEFTYLGKWHVTFHYYLDSQQATAESDINIL